MAIVFSTSYKIAPPYGKKERPDGEDHRGRCDLRDELFSIGMTAPLRKIWGPFPPFRQTRRECGMLEYGTLQIGVNKFGPEIFRSKQTQAVLGGGATHQLVLTQRAAHGGQRRRYCGI